MASKTYSDANLTVPSCVPQALLQKAAAVAQIPYRCEELLRCPALLPCLRISLCRCVPVKMWLTVVAVVVCC